MESGDIMKFSVSDSVCCYVFVCKYVFH